MNTRRLIQLFALVMIGDGVTGLLKPRRHSLLWDVGPNPLRRAMEALVTHPGQARLLYAAEIGIGAWIAAQQVPESVKLP
jgi:hypothetical protein